jgi:hypothetical protein
VLMGSGKCFVRGVEGLGGTEPRAVQGARILPEFRLLATG